MPPSNRLGIVLDHPLRVVPSVRPAHDERAGRAGAVVVKNRLVHVLGQLDEALARLVVGVLRRVLDRHPVPALVARRKGIALGQRSGKEGAGAEFRSREAARMDDDLSVPALRQQDLELGVVEDGAVDVAVHHRRRAHFVGVDHRRNDGARVGRQDFRRVPGGAGLERDQARERQGQCAETMPCEFHEVFSSGAIRPCFLESMQMSRGPGRDLHRLRYR